MGVILPRGRVTEGFGKNLRVFDASNDAMYLSKGIDADANPDAFQ